MAASDPMKMLGAENTDPDDSRSYTPGAWDQVRQAYFDGHITEEAYVILSTTIWGLAARSGVDTDADNEAFYERAVQDLRDAGVPEKPARDLIEGARDVATTYRTAIIGEWDS